MTSLGLSLPLLGRLFFLCTPVAHSFIPPFVVYTGRGIFFEHVNAVPLASFLARNGKALYTLYRVDGFQNRHKGNCPSCICWVHN
ncbi:UNVERIFIED_ORG: hypothetical protein ABRZ91_001092 [Heyndrickxia coagulans]